MKEIDLIETYLRQVRTSSGALDDVAAWLDGGVPGEGMRRFAVGHGLDERSTYGPTFALEDARRRAAHRVNQAQKCLEELERATRRYLDRATCSTHYRL
jgi:hypothetical protein